ncbi:MAG: methyltransferase domain-containing protein [Opitutaceae bacterium]|jgi:SAM-dependent methyltransferase
MDSPNLKAWLKSHLPGLRGALRYKSLLLRGRHIDAYLTDAAAPSLNLGCGLNVLPDWMNTDLFPELSSIIALDATRPFPFPDASFTFVFSEHMIEHVPFADARRMLAEIRRVMQPGGVVRIATPDLARVVALYEDTPETIAYRHWSRALHSRPGPGGDRCHVINSLFYGHGHRFLYDNETLSALLVEAGFHSPVRHVPGESLRPELRNIEHHGKVIGEANNRMETLVIEAIA